MVGWGDGLNVGAFLVSQIKDLLAQFRVNWLSSDRPLTYLMILTIHAAHVTSCKENGPCASTDGERRLFAEVRQDGGY
jgi:hypothetical protein